MITFELPIEPVAKGRPRFDRRGFAYTPAKTREFENTVKLLVGRFKPREPLSGPVKLTLLFFMKAPKRKVREYPTVKPDIDNLQKAIKDALNGIFWNDDAQVIDSHAYKRYGESPCIRVIVEEA